MIVIMVVQVIVESLMMEVYKCDFCDGGGGGGGGGGAEGDGGKAE